MSLDLSVYTRIQLLRAGERDDDFEEAHGSAIDGDVVYLWANPDFPDHSEGHVDGYYRVERSAEQIDMSLRASFYNFWRSELCLMCTGQPIKEVWANGVVAEGFMPLLDFGDNEGFIGPARCRQLAADFQAWAGRARQHAQQLAHRESAEVANSWLQIYDAWTRLFAAAAPNGVVQFH